MSLPGMNPGVSRSRPLLIYATRRGGHGAVRGDAPAQPGRERAWAGGRRAAASVGRGGGQGRASCRRSSGPAQSGVGRGPLCRPAGAAARPQGPGPARGPRPLAAGLPPLPDLQPAGGAGGPGPGLGLSARAAPAPGAGRHHRLPAAAPERAGPRPHLPGRARLAAAAALAANPAGRPGGRGTGGERGAWPVAGARAGSGCRLRRGCAGRGRGVLRRAAAPWPHRALRPARRRLAGLQSVRGGAGLGGRRRPGAPFLGAAAAGAGAGRGDVRRPGRYPGHPGGRGVGVLGGRTRPADHGPPPPSVMRVAGNPALQCGGYPLRPVRKPAGGRPWVPSCRAQPRVSTRSCPAPGRAASVRWSGGGPYSCTAPLSRRPLALSGRVAPRWSVTRGRPRPHAHGPVAPGQRPHIGVLLTPVGAPNGAFATTGSPSCDAALSLQGIRELEVAMDTRILIIEDDEATAEVMRQVLADEGYTVEHAASPRQARALLAAGDAASWDLVISDAVLTGDGDPRAWLNELRVLTAAPVVIVTGWLQALFADYAERCFAASRHWSRRPSPSRSGSANGRSICTYTRRWGGSTSSGTTACTARSAGKRCACAHAWRTPWPTPCTCWNRPARPMPWPAR